MAKVLVVDDQPDTVALLQMVLEDEHEVLVAYDGQEALEAVADGQPDLVLLDVAMPRLDGFRVLNRLRSDPLTARLPVIMLSAHDEPEDLAMGLTLGADYYLGKPFEIDVVTALVARHVGTPPPRASRST